MFMKWKKIIVLSLVILTGWSICCLKVSADSIDKTTLEYYGGPCVITNGDKQQLAFDGYGNYTGTLITISDGMKATTPVECYSVVEDSDKFVYEPKYIGDVRFYCSNGKDMSAYCDTGNGIKAISVDRNAGKSILVIDGKRYEFSVAVYSYIFKQTLWVDGISDGTVEVKETDRGLQASGVTGKIKMHFGEKEKNYYAFGTVSLDANGRLLGILELNNRKKKKPVSLYVRPANNGKHMALTWTKVKKAKSYIVYKYDTKHHKYKRIAVRNGQSSNYYITPIKGNEAYTYKVVARAGKNGGGKRIGKASYAVTAVPQTASKGNAKAVKIKSAKTLKMKRGRSVRLKASVESPAEPLYSGKVRWCASNRKVLKVNTMTGKIRAKKKGTCYIWAKAHNGLNSKKIKVVVK